MIYYLVVLLLRMKFVSNINVTLGILFIIYRNIFLEMPNIKGFRRNEKACFYFPNLTIAQERIVALKCIRKPFCEKKNSL